MRGFSHNYHIFFAKFRSSHQRCSIKKLFSKNYNIHRKTPVLQSLFNKVATLQTCNFTKKRLQHRCFLMNIATFLRTPILKNISERLFAQVFIYFLLQEGELYTYTIITVDSHPTLKWLHHRMPVRNEIFAFL